MTFLKRIHLRTWLLAAGLLLAAVALGLGLRLVLAGSAQSPAGAISPIHPTFAMLDADAVNVLESGQPVSTMKTCGQCHDTTYIEQHSFHADLGLSDIQAGAEITGQSWDLGNGSFGKWDPLTYRYLSSSADELLDLSTAEWIATDGLRHVGGGPGFTSRLGLPLADLSVQAGNPETTILDSATGEVVPWDWNVSGTIEMNCFLCHMPNPDIDARNAAIQNMQFGLANTATLASTDLLTTDEEGNLVWNAAAFDENGELLAENVAIQDPTNANCALCHGLVHTDETPVTLTGCSLDNPQTATTGQLVSSQKISESGMNITNKDLLARSWDIHAERQLQCTDCHYSLNNPIYYQPAEGTTLAELEFDPRRLDFGEYLKYPSHDFARGQSAQFTVDPENKATMRRCESCHDAQTIHADWLPYTEQHMSSVACESCHIPQLYAPAIEAYDWTVVTLTGEAQSTCRGVEGDPDSLASLVTGYEPVLIQRTNVDGQTMLAPYNLITTWFWVYDDANGNTLPVRQADLVSVYLAGGKYAPEVVAAFDADADGQLASTELVLDTSAKQELITGRLAALGLGNPRIQGTIQPYSINHNVAGGEYAIKDCATCHTTDSQLTQPIQLAAYVPAGVTPAFAAGTNVSATGEIYTGENGALFYRMDTHAEGLYILGHNRVAWVDWVGGLFLLGVLAGVGGHGGLRILKSLKTRKDKHAVKKVYMYQPYERFWHWLQTILILTLLITGLFIHRPDIFNVSFRGLVTIHNVSAVILALNAALSLFYHLTTGEIRHFIPRPYGFFDDAIVQAKYYLGGIFKHEAHPFEKTPDKKMNPLQQITYLGILNVLLPLQGLTGIVMWGAQQWPDVAAKLGGLSGLAPFHTLLAWLFAAFIIAHVYLTTTSGPKPLDSIKAMVVGWEDVEEYEQAPKPVKQEKSKK